MIDKLGKYKILKELGQGTFAIVYQATDTTLDRDVALKVLRPVLISDPGFVSRFRQEAKTVAGLKHPHIITVYEVSEADGYLFIAMELAKGTDLEIFISQHDAIPWDETLKLLKPVCDALDYAHKQGIVHRDLKPANILIDTERGPLLSDFGFARWMSNNSLSFSMSGGIIGTPAYIAPEIWDEDASAVPADIYALACITYEMLTGNVLFKGNTPMRIMRAHDKGAQFNLDALKHCPAGTVDVLARALAQDPAKRIQSAGELLAQLENLSKPSQRANTASNFRGKLLAVLENLSKPQLTVSTPKPENRARKIDANTLVWEKDGKAMVRVPAGEFLYGYFKKKRTLPEFWIDKTPVTNAEYARFVKASGYKTNGDWDGIPDGKENHPVVKVTWYDATAYATWASKRLPTEEEWEKAARGVDGRAYPWGNTKPDKSLANFGEHEGGTTPVGKYSPQGDSPYGCVDMAGNVWEWCADWFDEDKDARVLRGGSWDDIVNPLLAVHRLHVNPDVSYDFVGFRCVLDGSAHN